MKSNQITFLKHIFIVKAILMKYVNLKEKQKEINFNHRS
jgi:hypothetical protein